MTAPAAIPDTVQTPEVLIDLDILQRNINALARAVASRGQRLRPHAYPDSHFLCLLPPAQ